MDKSIDSIFDEVKSTSELEKPGILERGLKLTEECGELAAEILKLEGFKRTDESEEVIKEKILLESTDCLIMVLDIMSQMGFSKEQIHEMSMKQIGKWKRGIETQPYI